MQPDVCGTTSGTTPLNIRNASGREVELMNQIRKEPEVQQALFRKSSASWNLFNFPAAPDFRNNFLEERNVKLPCEGKSESSRDFAPLCRKTCTESSGAIFRKYIRKPLYDAVFRL